MTVREICKAHDITTLDQQDELLVKLAQDRRALLAVVKSLDGITRYYTTRYVEIHQMEWADLMTKAEAAIAQAEAQ